MRSQSETSQRLLLTLGLWAMSFLVFGGFMLVSEQGASLPWLLLWLCAVTVTGLGFSLALYALSRRDPGSWGLALGVLAATAGQSAVDHLILRLVLAHGGRGVMPDLAYGIGLNVVVYIWIFALYAAALKLLHASQLAREREEQLARARSAADQAQLAALRYQLNPHFLFNTLNAISSLIVNGRNAEAETMMSRLSSFLRSSLASDPNGLIPLEDELATVDAYLAIEAVRFGARLNVQMSTPPDLLDARVPGFLLQPLVENTMKHAVAPSVEPVTLALEGRADGDTLVITVADDGRADGGACGGAGVGLKNVRERLELLYGERGSLLAEHGPAGFTAEIRLPLER